MHTSSVDAVDMMEQNTGMAWTEEQKAAAREELGLDKSVPVQYLNWVGNMLKGDMGTSYISGQPVLQMFLEKLPMTIYLTNTSVLSCWPGWSRTPDLKKKKKKRKRKT